MEQVLHAGEVRVWGTALNVVGMFWNYNEGDILPQTLEAASDKVDSLFIADDGSTDNSWEIIKQFADEHKDKVEHIQQKPDKSDKGQRQSLLEEMRKRYDDSTWVQIIESDVMVLDTNVKEAIRNHSVEGLAVSWQTLNAIRRSWDDVDTYPNWETPLLELMPYAHYMEYMLYTFRLLPELSYRQPYWRPWPTGFSKYTSKPVKVNRRTLDAPLLAHVGFRGPTHFYHKYKHMGERHTKYKDWILTSPETVKETVFFFNGVWNRCRFEMSRDGWISWRRGRKK